MKPSLRAKRDNPFFRRRLLDCFVVVLLAMTTVFPAHAEDFVYAPKHCDFTVTFPSAPEMARHCDASDNDKCYEQAQFTQVFDHSASVNFKVICNPLGADIYNHYSAQVMEATLRAMTDKNVVKTFETSYRDSEGYKQAGLVGEGLKGKLPTIYIAQLWISETSALSVEAELVGETHEEADKLFSEVLRSVGFSKITDGSGSE